MSEEKKVQDKVEEPKPEPKPEPAKFDESKLAALEARLKAAEEKAAEADKALAAEREARRAEREAGRFAEAFDKAHTEGRVNPAERDALYAVYCALPHDEDKTVEFGEAKEQKGLRSILLDAIATRPENKALFNQTVDGSKDVNRQSKSDNPADAIFAEAQRIQKEKNWGDDKFQDALMLASRKLERGR